MELFLMSPLDPKHPIYILIIATTPAPSTQGICRNSRYWKLSCPRIINLLFQSSTCFHVGELLVLFLDVCLLTTQLPNTALDPEVQTADATLEVFQLAPQAALLSSFGLTQRH